MKHNWEYKRLGDIGTIVTGSTPSTQDEMYYSSCDVMFVKPGDISENKLSVIDHTETYVSKLAYEKVCRQLPKGTVVVTCIGILGKTGILNKDACCNQQINAIIPSNDILSRYLGYAILSIQEELASKKNGPVVPIINKSKFSKFSIPVPPMEVQERIVAELDKINELIEAKREQLKQLDALAQSLFYDTFGDPITNPKGWEMVTIESVCSHIVDCPHSTPQKSLVPTDFPCIRTSELTDSGINWSTMQYLNEDEYIKRTQRLKPQYGDIIYGREGTVGGCVMVPKEKHFCLGQRTMMFRPSTINCIFLLATFRSKWVRHQTEQKIVGQTVKHVNIKDLIKFTIPNPPMCLQEQFAAQVEVIEAQKVTIEKSISELQTLLDSRMDYWFN